MRLLANTQHNITTIAMLTGLSSHAHLTTTFKKHTDGTPHSYRLQAR
jgi:AraC family transcriptional regulator